MYGQIYKITNIINNKVYIGQTIKENPIDRYEGNLLKTHNKHLKNSIIKYGIENFTIETLCFCNSKEELNKKEIEYISLYNSCDNNFGYNKHKGGIGGRQNDYVLNQISETMKQQWKNNPEKWEQRSIMLSGENNPLVKKGGHSEESRLKMSNSKKKLFSEGKLKFSESAIINSHTKESNEKRKITRSKNWFIQYDKNMNEINKFHTLHDLYDYLVENKIETKRKTYGGFKNKKCKDEVFSKNGYNGYYFKIINKEEYANAEVS